MESFASTKIQRWWRKNTAIYKLSNIKKEIESSLSTSDIQELSNNCAAITRTCVGDGAGLLGGGLIDMYLSKLFQTKILSYQDCHHGESDMMIFNTRLSQKKINGKSTIALDWSKNTSENKKEKFDCDLIIINLKTEKWWKTRPNKIINSRIKYDNIIPAGIYILDKRFCKKFVSLSSNNKTNTLITSEYLYIMLKRSIYQQLYIFIPPPNKVVIFNILRAFSE